VSLVSANSSHKMSKRVLVTGSLTSKSSSSSESDYRIIGS
jgi:hypothetical protein